MSTSGTNGCDERICSIADITETARQAGQLIRVRLVADAGQVS